MEALEKNGDVYKGEGTDEDLSTYSDDYIYEHLKDKIYPTTVTIVLISPNMRNQSRSDKSQWIPWEIFYSIYEANRNGRKSHTNAILAVVLPDAFGSYSYMIEDRNCCASECQLYHTDKLFTILRKNMFNQEYKETVDCNCNQRVYRGQFSYIPVVKWCDFVEDMNRYIAVAEWTRDNIEQYKIHRSVEQ
jgi:hypothetical protein